MKNEPNYERLMVVGLVLTILAIAGFSVYWLQDSTRLVKAAESLNRERVSLGARIYQAQCVACHGAQGEGGLGFVLNSKQLLQNTPNEVFFSLIRSGVPNTKMPAWSIDFGGPLTDEDILNVVAFIRNWEPNAPDIQPVVFTPSAERGAVLFNSTCALCHGENGKGNQTGAPAVNDTKRLSQLDNEWYTDVIKNGRPAKGMPTWGTVLSPNQIADLVALVDSWRQGIEVKASFDINEEISAAVFSLKNNDPGSSLIRVQRAITVAPEMAAEILRNIESQLNANDTTGAMVNLEYLQQNWPIGDAVLGEALYAKKCSPCHGAQGQGISGKKLKPNEFVQQNTNAQLVKFVQEGRTGTGMAGFKGKLTEEELANIVAFLRTWQP